MFGPPDTPAPGPPLQLDWTKVFCYIEKMPILWRTIEQEPNYEVSNTGLVRIKKTGTLKAQPLNHNGYPKIMIDGRCSPNHTTKPNHWRVYLVHRLVAQAFLPPPLPGQMEINHKDAVKTNNHVSNLEWCTGTENLAHARALGLLSRSRKPGPGPRPNSEMTQDPTINTQNARF